MTRLFAPHDYQRGLIQHLYETPRAGLFAGMGTGKTVSTLTALNDLSLVEDVWPALIAAPLRVAQSTWPDEVQKWAHLSHLRVSPIVGDLKQRVAAMRRPAEIYTVNHENLPWLMEALKGGKLWRFRTVVCDESTKLKGFRLRQGTQRAKALAPVAHRVTPRWINLTGTPAPNGLQDLWGQTWFLDKGQRLGLSFDAFKMRFFQSVQVDADRHAVKLEALPFAQEQIMDLLKDICLSVTFPWAEEPVVKPVYVELPSKARRTYDEMEKQMFVEIAGQGVEAFNAGSRTMKCLQIANGALYTDEKCTQWADVHDAKLAALESILEEAAGMPVLCAYHFKHDLARILKAFPKARVLDDNPQTIRDWNAGKIPLLCAHPASAGHGLNLQDGGNIITYFGHWWDYELYSQILERIGPTRQKQSGYDRPTYVYPIIARDTVDELVVANRGGKADLHTVLMDYMKRKTR